MKLNVYFSSGARLIRSILDEVKKELDDSPEIQGEDKCNDRWWCDERKKKRLHRELTRQNYAVCP